MVSGPEYDERAIRSSVLASWQSYNFFVLPYFSKRSGKNNDVTNFILDFKNQWPKSVNLVSGLMGDTVAGIEKRLRYDLKCQYIVSTPPSSQGTARPASEFVCKSLAARFGWLKHLPGALQRTAAVKKSAYAQPGERPGYDDHLKSIAWVGPDLDLKGRGVILFDDVYTRGETSSACRTIIKQKTGCSVVVGIFLGRTQ